MRPYAKKGAMETIFARFIPSLDESTASPAPLAACKRKNTSRGSLYSSSSNGEISSAPSTRPDHSIMSNSLSISQPFVPPLVDACRVSTPLLWRSDAPPGTAVCSLARFVSFHLGRRCLNFGGSAGIPGGCIVAEIIFWQISGRNKTSSGLKRIRFLCLSSVLFRR